MNDPLDRLRAVLDAAPSGDTTDAAALGRRAAVRRWRQLALTGTASSCVLALVLTGSGSSQQLGITTLPSASSMPSQPPVPELTATAVPWPSPSASPSRPARPKPSRSARAGSPASVSPQPAPTAGAVRWPATDKVGPAPFFAKRYSEGEAVPYECDPDRYCFVNYFDIGYDRPDDFRAALVICWAGPDQTIHYPTEQEIDLFIHESGTGDDVFTWSAHQDYAPVPHDQTIGQGDCVHYYWHLDMADDAGRRLVTGREYTIGIKPIGLGNSGGEYVSEPFVAP